MTLRRCAALVLATALMLSGCSSGSNQPPPAGGNAELGSTSDTNPQDPATLRQGGNLRLSLPSLPANFNSLQIDGNEATTGGVLRWTLPRAFVVTVRRRSTPTTSPISH
jgi:peptide/nickel transport system substrate-binding protein